MYQYLSELTPYFKIKRTHHCFFFFCFVFFLLFEIHFFYFFEVGVNAGQSSIRHMRWTVKHPMRKELIYDGFRNGNIVKRGTRKAVHSFFLTIRTRICSMTREVIIFTDVCSANYDCYYPGSQNIKRLSCNHYMIIDSFIYCDKVLDFHLCFAKSKRMQRHAVPFPAPIIDFSAIDGRHKNMQYRFSFL